MTMRFFIQVVALTVSGLGLLPGSLRADEGTNTPPPPLQVSLEREPVAYTDPYYRAYVTVGTNKFSFLIPTGFRFQTDAGSGKVAFCNRDGSISLSFAIHASQSEVEGELSADYYRELVAGDHPLAKINAEFARSAAGRKGPGYDVQWKVSDDLYQGKRIVFIPSAVGVLEFTASGSLANATKVQSDLDFVLTTFAASKDGKLKVTHLGNVN
jgi:hypothetical protein